MSERVVFLDFDGVIRGAYDPESLAPAREDFCPERMERVRKCCEILEAKVVISSDWRNCGLADNLDDDESVVPAIVTAVVQNREEVEGYLGRLGLLLHDDWATPVKGARWKEVADWLRRHPEVTEYAVLEDQEMHFRNAPEEMARRVVLCNNRHGFVAGLTGRLCLLFSPAAADEWPPKTCPKCKVRGWIDASPEWGKMYRCRACKTWHNVPDKKGVNHED